MSIKHNLFKVFIYVFSTGIATTFGWESSKALSIETKAITEQTVDERLTNVRKQLRQEVRNTVGESISNISPRDNHELEKSNSGIKKNILAWNNWGNWVNWNNWRNWANNWSNWVNY